MFDRIRRAARVVRALAFTGPDSNGTLALEFQRRAAAHPQRPFLIFQGARYSYEEANALVNRHAHAYRELGIGRGDVVALMMDNRPELLWHFLAAGKLGAVASLLNTHNVGEPLAHSLRICEPGLIVVGAEHAPEVEAVAAGLPADASVHVQDDPWSDGQSAASARPRFDALLEPASTADPDSTGQQRLGDLGAYIYTSGTTGLPKAARVTQQRLVGLGWLLGGVGWVMRQDDVIYNPLPLYHTSGMGVCTASVICWGATMVMARRFSASGFWEDVRRHGATGFVYIGELCRYLVNQPPRDDDADNPVRVAVGNGLRPDIWPEFRDRFGIERIAEFYGSTEGNVGTINLDGTVGSVGRLLSGGGVLVRWDDDAEDFVRGADGFMVKCKPGEPGVLIGRITRRSRFDGYQDEGATEKKVLRDVFKPGDAWFNTGDMLRMDRRRRLFFVDRMGDTFRWKGENVSTFEVQEQISTFDPVREVNVYGVHIHGTEGRAGMAAVVLEGQFDPDAFRRHVDEALPPYARPVFVRLQAAMETTGTLKLKKTELRDEGFDPAQVSDPIFVRHPQHDAYVPLTPELHASIVGGGLRL